MLGTNYDELESYLRKVANAFSYDSAFKHCESETESSTSLCGSLFHRLPFTFILIYPAGIQSVLPEIIPSTPSLRVDERNSFTILCQARTGDFQHLSWHKRGRTQDLPDVLTRNKHNITSTLTIGHAQLDDAGEYLCYGYGWTANETKMSVINVSVTGMTMSSFLTHFGRPVLEMVSHN